MKSNIIILFSVLLCNCSCSTNTETDNLKEYFWQLNEFENPKVLVYKTENSGTIGKTYYVIEKISTDKLKVKKFSDDFILLSVLVDSFTENGVYLESVSFFTEGVETEVSIDEGFIFPYKSRDSSLFVSSSYKLISNSGITLKDEDSWQIKSSLVKEINGMNLETLVATGKSKRQYFNEESNEVKDYDIKVQIDYSKGIGITSMTQKTLWHTYKETYIETISIEQFSKLKGQKGN